MAQVFATTAGLAFIFGMVWLMLHYWYVILGIIILMLLMMVIVD